jgi:hypothetical protein
MTTVSDVVTLALRQGRVIGVNATPTASEAAAGLQAFQAMLDQWVTGGMFGSLCDIYLEDDGTALEGKRYLLASGVTLAYPSIVEGQGGDYGEEGNSSSRQPYDLSLVESVTSTGTRTVKLWDRTEWVDLLGLTLTSDAPLSSRGLTGLAACVAKTYCEMFGRDLGPNTQMLARRFEGALSHKFGSTRPAATAEYF